MNKYAAVLGGLLVAAGVYITSALPRQAHTNTTVSGSDIKQHIAHVKRVVRKPKLRHKPKWIHAIATWYSPYDGNGQGFVTRMGTRVRDGVIAVDPAIVPLGSLVEIVFPNGTHRTFTAADTGGAIHGFRVDIFNWSRQQCLLNGVQRIKLRIISYAR